MQQYEFVMVLLSIIVGLGITELLTNIARQIKGRATIRFYWPHTVITAVVFIAFLQQWWESWGLQSVQQWNFSTLLLMLAGPIGLYIISHMLFPEKWEKADLEAHYYSHSRVNWSLAVLTTVAATAFRPLSFGYELISYDNLASLFMIIVFGALAAFKRPLLHKILLPIIAVLIVSDIFVFSPNL